MLVECLDITEAEMNDSEFELYVSSVIEKEERLNKMDEDERESTINEMVTRRHMRAQLNKLFE